MVRYGYYIHYFNSIKSFHCRELWLGLAHDLIFYAHARRASILWYGTVSHISPLATGHRAPDTGPRRRRSKDITRVHQQLCSHHILVGYRLGLTECNGEVRR